MKESLIINNLKSKKFLKISFYIILFIVFIIIGSFYQIYKYNILLSNFRTNFDEYKFSDANNLIINNQNFNIFRKFNLNKDLTNYFTNKIDDLSNDLKNGYISNEYALMQLKEMTDYKLNLNNLTLILDSIKKSSDDYNEGLLYFNNNDYYNAITSFNKVSMLDFNYSDSLKYLNESKNKIKEDLLSKCDELIKNDYYTQALNEISNNKLFNNDSDINKKILEIKSLKQQYLDKNSSLAEASSSALITSITPNNINELNIESLTRYLINVDINTQKTYIYNGSKNNWILLKTYPCSTGTYGDETPLGSFSIQEKGDWFFSEQYNEGAKYWSQITGNILFHSLPFNRDQATIVDYTMSKPASHGCIRLYPNDAKWLYDNIPKGSKVIIK